MKLFHLILIAFNLLVTLIAAFHALINKRDSRAALGWISVCIMFPVFGSLLYFIFGINRIRTRARKLAELSPFRINETDEQYKDSTIRITASDISMSPESTRIARISDVITRRPLIKGNDIQILHNGEQAFPSMLDAIDSAKSSIFLSTYIFETNSTGKQFVDALGRATKRGIEVKVLLDGIGELYSWPFARTLLQHHDIRTARFLPPRICPPTLHINLRNHRKILTTDGNVGFVGGMNIGDRHLADNKKNPSRLIDIHFRMTGPIVRQIEQVFLEDWRFATGELPEPESRSLIKTGDAICRVIVDGPNEDIDKLSATLLGAITRANNRIMIMTPYFLPSRGIIAVLQTAALSGVNVSVVLPSKNNIPFIHWATRKMLWEILQCGVHVYYQPPPFVHSKLLIVDDYYAQVGSANIDQRSLRLNFELTVEIYDKSFVTQLSSHVEKCISISKEVSLKEMDSRPLHVKARDAMAWLFSPYL